MPTPAPNKAADWLIVEPVFLGSSFAFLGSMFAAFGGAASMSIGFLGVIIGAVFAGLVYVVLALVCKKFGTGWISKLMPAVVIGPTVAIIGLSLSANAVANVFGYGDTGSFAASEGAISLHVAACIFVGLVTLFTVIITSVYSKPKGFLRLIPFVVGIGVGYLVALALTGLGISDLICNRDIPYFSRTKIDGLVATDRSSSTELGNIDCLLHIIEVVVDTAVSFSVFRSYFLASNECLTRYCLDFDRERHIDCSVFRLRLESH